MAISPQTNEHLSSPAIGCSDDGLHCHSSNCQQARQGNLAVAEEELMDRVVATGKVAAGACHQILCSSNERWPAGRSVSQYPVLISHHAVSCKSSGG